LAIGSEGRQQSWLFRGKRMRNMRKLLTTLTATMVFAGSVAWKAEAATITGIGSLPPQAKTYLPLERVDCFLGPCSRPPDDLNLGPNRAELYNYYRRGYPPPNGWYPCPPYGWCPYPPHGWNGYGSSGRR
jgi:hypothetical protein